MFNNGRLQKEKMSELTFNPAQAQSEALVGQKELVKRQSADAGLPGVDFSDLK